MATGSGIVPATSSAVRVTCRSSSSSSRSSTCWRRSPSARRRRRRCCARSWWPPRPCARPGRGCEPTSRAPSPRAARRAMCSARSPLRSRSGSIRRTATSSRRSSDCVVRRPDGCWARSAIWWVRTSTSLVALHELLGRLAVAGQEGVGGPGDGLAHQGEDLHEDPVDLDRSAGRVASTRRSARGRRRPVDAEARWGAPTRRVLGLGRPRRLGSRQLGRLGRPPLAAGEAKGHRIHRTADPPGGGTGARGAIPGPVTPPRYAAPS